VPFLYTLLTTRIPHTHRYTLPPRPTIINKLTMPPSTPARPRPLCIAIKGDCPSQTFSGATTPYSTTSRRRYSLLAVSTSHAPSSPVATPPIWWIPQPLPLPAPAPQPSPGSHPRGQMCLYTALKETNPAE